MISEIVEVIRELLEMIKQMFCSHEYESSNIGEGTFSEVNSWCKKCGKTPNY